MESKVELLFPPTNDLYRILDDSVAAWMQQREQASRSEQSAAKLVSISLYRLFKAVQRFGGYVRVQSKESWEQVCAILFIDPSCSSECQERLREVYAKYLLPFELSETSFQLAASHSDTSYPPSNLKTGADTEISEAQVEEKVMDVDRIDNLLNLAAEGVSSALKSIARTDTMEQQMQFNRGVISTISTSPMKAVKKETCAEIGDQTTQSMQDTGSNEVRVGILFWKYFPELNTCYKGEIIEKSRSGICTVEYQLSQHYCPVRNAYKKPRLKQVDSLQSTASEMKDSFCEAIELVDIRGFLLTGQTAEDAYNAYHLGICQVCSTSSSPHKLVTCVCCGCSFHGFCLSPVLDYIPETDWMCESCAAVTPAFSFTLADYGYEEGVYYSINRYAEMSELFLQDFVSKHNLVAPTSAPKFENLYWSVVAEEARLVESNFFKHELTVDYGSDLDTGKLGSGFPVSKLVARKVEQKNLLGRTMGKKTDFQYTKTMNNFSKLKAEIHEMEQYVHHPWNLNNFPGAQGSLLQYVDSSITGVVVPWLYIGMSLSSFAFHTEDHYFASINYHHFGAPKTWYGISERQAALFEDTCRKLCPDLFLQREDLLTGIVTQFSPKDLICASKGELAIFRIVQMPGDFVITFPRAYHGGFNHGFNCAEAVNFATPTWLRHGYQCLDRYKILKKNPVIAHDTLICSLYRFVSAMKDSSFSATLKENLAVALKEMVLRELSTRQWFLKKVGRSSLAVVHSAPGDKKYLENGKVAQESTTLFDVAHTEKALKVQGRERASIMGRMSGLSKLYKRLNQCAICKCYCSLSFVYDEEKKLAYCLEHAVQEFESTGSETAPNSVKNGALSTPARTFVYLMSDHQLRTMTLEF